MQTVRHVVTTNPNPPVIARDALIQCIEVDCVDICASTQRILARHVEPEVDLLIRQLELCAAACALCTAECGQGVLVDRA